MNRIKTTFKVNYSAKNEAFPYQTQAFLTVKDMDYCAIFHEQGLGKTKIAIDILLYWLSKRDIDTVMIVTKKQLVKNWVEEFAIHTYIKPKVLSNNKNDNFFVLNSPTKIIITNFETLSTDKERILLFLKCRNVGIIIDESTKLKNPNTRLTRDFFELSEFFKIRMIMTGTPVANRPYDIWSQIYFLDHGKSLGTNFDEFKDATDLKNNLKDNNLKRNAFEEKVSHIFARISNFSVRETKNSCGIELPQKEYISEYVDFSTLQLKMYKKILNEMAIEIQKEGKKILDDDTAVLKRLLRLIQISSNPKLVDESYNELSSKEKKLTELLEKIDKKNEKCIVWSNFIDNIEYFYKKFSFFNPRKIHGALSIEERNNAVEIFKKEDSCKVLFATPQAAKEGLTLTVANHVIFYDRGFNLDDYLQAQDRIHRISQKKKCFVYNILIENSIDEWIDKLLEAKQYAAFLAQGDIDLKKYKQYADYSYGELIKEIIETER